MSWKTALLRVHPIVITLEGIALTASPRAEDEWAAEPAERRAQALKRAALAAAAEIAAQKRRSLGGGRGEGDGAPGGKREEAGTSYGHVLEAMRETLLVTVLDRLRLKIGSVHVKFTDIPRPTRAGGVSGCDAASFGLCLDSLVVQSSTNQAIPDHATSVASSAGARAEAGKGKGKESGAGGGGRRRLWGFGVRSEGGGECLTSDPGEGHDADADDEALRASEQRGGGGRGSQPPVGSTKKKRGSTSTVAGLLSMVTPISEAKKHIEIVGLRVYGHTNESSRRKEGAEEDEAGELWYQWCPNAGAGSRFPNPGPPGEEDWDGGGGRFRLSGAHDDTVNPDDVMVAAENLTALLTVTVVSKTTVSNGGAEGGGATSTGAGGAVRKESGGFNTCLQLNSAVEVRVRPSQVRSAVRLVDAVAVWKLRERHGAIRPARRPTKNSGGWGEWWRYAGRAVLNDMGAGYVRGYNMSSEALREGDGEQASSPDGRRGGWKRTPRLLRYVKLYREKLRRELEGQERAAAVEDDCDIPGADETFYDCETITASELEGLAGMAWPSMSAELYSLESELSLEELLEAREKAELSLHLNEDDDDFLDCEDVDSSEDMDEEDDEKDESNHDYWSWRDGIGGNPNDNSEAASATSSSMAGFVPGIAIATRRCSGGLDTASTGSGVGGDGVKERGSIARTASAVFRRGGKFLAGAVGLAASAASAAVQIASDNSETTIKNRAAFTLEATSVSFTFCAEAAETSTSTSHTDVPVSRELFQIELKQIKLQSVTNASPGDGDDATTGAFDFHVCIEDIEGWVIDGERAVWRRPAVGPDGTPSLGPAIWALKRSSDVENSGGSERTSVQPLEVHVAPLVFLLHPKVAEVMSSFSQEVPGTFYRHLLFAVCRLPGRSPRERLARAVASIDLNVRAQPWHLVVSHPLFLLHSTVTSTPSETTTFAKTNRRVASPASAGALEFSRVAVEWAPGGERALTPLEIDDARKIAEDVVESGGNEDADEVNEALRAIEEAATTHQASVSFAGVRVSVPVFGSSRAGGGITWSPVCENLGGSLAVVLRSLAVGGPDAANRMRVRLSPSKISLSPSIVAAMPLVQAGAHAVKAALPNGPPPPPIPSNPALEVEFSLAEVELEAYVDPSSEVYRARVEQVTVHSGMSRKGHKWISVAVQSFMVDMVSSAMRRCPLLQHTKVRMGVGENTGRGPDGSNRVENRDTLDQSVDATRSLVLHVKGAFPASGHGPATLRVDARGVEALISTNLVAAATDFENAVSASSENTVAKFGTTNHTALVDLDSGRQGQRRRSLQLIVGDAISDMSENNVTRDADWDALSKPFSLSLPALSTSRDDLTIECVLASPVRVVLVDGSIDTAGDGVPVAVVDIGMVKFKLINPGYRQTDPPVPQSITLDIGGAQLWAPKTDAKAWSGSGASTSVVDPGTLMNLPLHPSEQDTVLLVLAVLGKASKSTVAAKSKSQTKGQIIEVHVHQLRVGAHAGALLRISLWTDVVGSYAAKFTASPGQTESEELLHANETNSPVGGSDLVSITLADTSLFIPSPSNVGSGDGCRRGLLLSVGSSRLKIRIPPGSDDVQLASLSVDGIWLTATSPEEHEWVAALQSAPQAISPSRAGRAAPGKIPSLLAVGPIRGEERMHSQGGEVDATEDGTSGHCFDISVPLVSCTLTPGSVALLAGAASGFEAANTAEASAVKESRKTSATNPRASSTKSKRKAAQQAQGQSQSSTIAPVFNQGAAPKTLPSVFLTLGRASLMLQSSNSRQGRFGIKGDETAALVTLTSFRVSLNPTDSVESDGGGIKFGVLSSSDVRTSLSSHEGSDSHQKLVVTFESIHGLDVSGTLAGEAERMAAGVSLGDGYADVGIPLAWVGGPSPLPLTSVAINTTLHDGADGGAVPSRIACIISLGGGGCAANIPAWDRVMTLGSILSNQAQRSTNELRDSQAESLPPLPPPPVPDNHTGLTGSSSADSVAGTIAAMSVAGAFSTGEWVITLPWNTPGDAIPGEAGAGARVMQLLVDARASVSASVNVRTREVAHWVGDVFLNSLKLDIKEAAANERPGFGSQQDGMNSVVMRTHSIIDLRGVGCNANADGAGAGDDPRGLSWSNGISVDIVARDVSVAVSTRRLQLIRELQSLLDDSKGGGQQPEKPPLPSPLLLPNVSKGAGRPSTLPQLSVSLQVDTIGLLALNDVLAPPSTVDDAGSGGTENIGVPLLEGAVVGLSASVTTDTQGRRVTLNVEAQTLMDFINHQKGAWEPIVEPWRVRLGAEVVMGSSGAGCPNISPSRIALNITGVDALELTVTEAGSVASAAAVLALVNGIGLGSASDIGVSSGAGREPAAATLELQRKTQRQHHSYWLQNATSVPVRYWLAAQDSSVSGESAVDRDLTQNDASTPDGVVAAGERALLCFPEVKSRAAPRYSSVAGVKETWTRPALPPPPAPTRAVVLHLEGAERPSRPIPLDRPSAHVLDRDAWGTRTGGGDGVDVAHDQGNIRLVAEVRRVSDSEVDRPYGGGLVRSELILRSDLAFHNVTLSPVELRFDRRLGLNLVGSTMVAVAPGERVWLPPPLAGEARMQWRPAVVNADSGNAGGSVVVRSSGPEVAVDLPRIGAVLRRVEPKSRLSVSGADSMPDMQSAVDKVEVSASRGEGDESPTVDSTSALKPTLPGDHVSGLDVVGTGEYAWSEPLQLRPMASNAELVAVDVSLPYVTSSSTFNSHDVFPFRCLLTAHHRPRAVATVLALSPPLYVTNQLLVPITVSVSSSSSGAAASTTSSSKSASAQENDRSGSPALISSGGRVIAPGAIAAIHVGSGVLSMDNAIPLTLHMRPAGHTHCQSIPMPAMPRCSGVSGSAGRRPEANVWTANRDVFAVGGRKSGGLAPVSLRIEVIADEYGTRWAWVSCPVSVVNTTQDSLVLKAVDLPQLDNPAESGELEADMASEAFDLHKSALMHAGGSNPAVAFSGEGDCWIPPASFPAPGAENATKKRPPPLRMGSGDEPLNVDTPSPRRASRDGTIMAPSGPLRSLLSSPHKLTASQQNLLGLDVAGSRPLSPRVDSQASSNTPLALVKKSTMSGGSNTLDDALVDSSNRRRSALALSGISGDSPKRADHSHDIHSDVDDLKSPKVVVRSNSDQMIGMLSTSKILREPIDASVGLSPGTSRARIFDANSRPDDQTMRTEPQMSYFMPSFEALREDASDADFHSAGIAMYGRSSLWPSSPQHAGQHSHAVKQVAQGRACHAPVQQLATTVRLRCPDSGQWSPTIRLALGGTPLVVQCPAKWHRVEAPAKSGAFHEYLVSLRSDRLASLGARRALLIYSGTLSRTRLGPSPSLSPSGGMVVIQPRFTVRSKLSERSTLWVRQPGSERARELHSESEMPVTQWSGPPGGGPRQLCFRPGGGVWSWTAPVAVDAPLVTYVKAISLLTQHGFNRLKGLGASHSCVTTSNIGTGGLGDIHSPVVRRQLGFSTPTSSTDRHSTISVGANASSAASAPETRVFCVAVTASVAEKGAWRIDVSELNPEEAEAQASVCVDNRSSVSIRFRQRDLPPHGAFDNRVLPHSTAHYLWDDPSLPHELVLGVLDGAGDMEPPVPFCDEVSALDASSTAPRWSRMAVVRYADQRKHPLLLRLRLERQQAGPRAEGGKVNGVTGKAVHTLIVEEVSAFADSAAAAVSTSAAATLSPVATRVMAPLLPRRLQPLAQALSFAADRASASVKMVKTTPMRPRPTSIEVVIELPSVGLSLVGGAGGGTELLYTRFTGARAGVLALAVIGGSGAEVGEKWSASLTEATLSLRVSRVRADLQTPGALAQPLVFSAGGAGPACQTRNSSGGISAIRHMRRPGSFNVRARGTGPPALAAKLVVIKQRELDDAGKPGESKECWLVQSAAVDTAPMTVDLQEELLLALPQVAQGLSRPFAAVIVAMSNDGADSQAPTASPSEGGSWQQQTSFSVATGTTANPGTPQSSSPVIGVASVKIGQVDITVSFTALPFLPWGIRSIGAVDRAKVCMGAFQLQAPMGLSAPAPPSPRSAAATVSLGSGSHAWTVDHVAAHVARHYVTEAAGQVVRLIASNKLLGDPARFWGEIHDAIKELQSAGVTSLRRGSGRRFRQRLAAAVAAAMKTTLAHARAVVTEVEARFEAARIGRMSRLRLRRINDSGQDSEGQGGDGNEAGDKGGTAGAGLGGMGGEDDEAHVPKTGDDDMMTDEGMMTASRFGDRGVGEGSDMGGAPAKVVTGVLRAAGNLVEGPLQGAELRGLPGLLEGAAEGIAGAAASVTAASLSLATALADWLHLFSAVPTQGMVTRGFSGGGGSGLGGGGSFHVRDGVGDGGVDGPMGGRGWAAPIRLRPPRPPPTNHLEPLLPFNSIQAMARELHAVAAGGRFKDETYVGGAALVRPRGAFVAITSRHVIIGVTPFARSEGNCGGFEVHSVVGEGGSEMTVAASWLVREALPLADLITSEVNNRVVVIRALPRRRVNPTSSGGERGGGGADPSRLAQAGMGGAVGGAEGGMIRAAEDSWLPLIVLQPVALVASTASAVTSRVAEGVSAVRAVASRAIRGRLGEGAVGEGAGAVAVGGGSTAATVASENGVSGGGRGVDEAGIREIALQCMDEVTAVRVREDLEAAVEAAEKREGEGGTREAGAKIVSI